MMLTPISLALYQPDIPQNAGTLMRLAACLGVSIELIEPAGFQLSDRAFRRAGMDYLDHASLLRHPSWDSFLLAQREARRRLILLTARGRVPYTDFAFAPGDTILTGRESAGAPEEVHAAAAARLCIPLLPEMRSLNVALAAAMVLGEALRQTKGFPA